MREPNDQDDWLPAQRRRMSDWSIERSVDIHCHCLAGLDDGPLDLQTAVSLCRALAHDGVTSVIATPHQLGAYDRANSAERVRRSVAELSESLAADGVPLEVFPGGEVRIDERLLSLLEQDQALTLADLGVCLLMELPHGQFVDPAPLFEPLLERSIQPIMAHPERHRYLRDQAHRIEDWVQRGALVQVTAGSLTGDFGRSASRVAWRLLDEGLVHVIASDAHDSSRRAPRMTDAIQALAEQAPEWLVRRVCLENPLRVLMGETITPGILSEE